MGWRWFLPTCKRGLGCPGIGPQGYDSLVRFKRLLIGQWHPQSWRGCPQLRLDLMLFCGLDLFVPVPDETTHCRFRNALVKGGIHDDLAVGVCRQIGDCGPKRWKVPTPPRQPY